MNGRQIFLCIWFIALGAACHRAPTLPVTQSEEQAASSLDAVPIAILPSEILAAVSKQSLALEVLQKNCGACHSAGNAQGNFGIIENVEEMLAGGRYLVPGSLEKSLLISKLAPTGNMPPAGSLKKEEIDILNDWVRELKPAVINRLSEEDAINLVRKDLELNVPQSQRAGIRYFSLHVPQNLGATPATLGILRQAFFKVINSLSRSPVIVQAKVIDRDNLIYRLQLSDLAISEVQFEKVIGNFYPFGQRFVAEGESAEALRAADDHLYLKNNLATENYMLRADWFVATATLPQLYAEFLQMGADQTALQQQIGVNQLQNIISSKVVRAGFKNSNVSSQNRIIERHVQNNGLGYWLSYDFASNEGPANIFNVPLGPLGAERDTRAFKHDGGEMIVQLPNGLLAYYLANAAGEKIDKGPTSIVKQADAPGQFLSAIVNGISCMSCHGAGLL